MQAIAASLMGPEDVVLFVSSSGATRDMMDTLRLAKDNGAKVILLTHYDDAAWHGAGGRGAAVRR